MLWAGGERAVVVTGAAFAPAAIGVLNGAQPLAGPQHVSFAIALAGRPQAAQREEGSVDIIDAPASVPASVRLLRAHQVIDAPAHGRIGRGRTRERTALRARAR